MVVEFLIVDKVPLPACVLVAPSVALSWEVYPFGMSELVAHEVEVASVDGGCRYKPYHLVQGDATMHHEVLVALLEVPVHVGIDETEDDGLVSHECLVVALTVGDGLLVASSVLHLPEYGAWLPVLVAQFLDGLNPVVRYVHGHAVVEAISSVLELGGQTRHAAYLLGNCHGLGVHLVYEQVCKREVADGVIVLMSVEVVLIATECLSESVAVV